MCNVLVKIHLGVSCKRIVVVFIVFSFSSLICPFLRPWFSSEAVMPELETGSQTAVCPDKGEHCLKEVTLLFLPLNSPSLKFGRNEKETVL